METGSEGLAPEELAKLLGSFDYKNSNELPPELLDSTMNGFPTTYKIGPKNIMTIDDENVEQVDPSMKAKITELLGSLSHVPSLYVYETHERIYYHPVTGKRIQ